MLIDDEPLLYVERGGAGLVTLADCPALAGAGVATHGAPRDADPLREALQALADAVRSGRVPKLSLERIDGEAAIASSLVDVLAELGFQAGPRRLTLCLRLRAAGAAPADMGVQRVLHAPAAFVYILESWGSMKWRLAPPGLLRSTGACPSGRAGSRARTWRATSAPASVAR